MTNTAFDARPHAWAGLLPRDRLQTVYLVLFLAWIYLYSPGVFISDSMSQYTNAVNGWFSNWWPTVMPMVWAALLPALGVHGVFIVHSAAYFLGLYCIAATLDRTRRTLRIVAYALPFLPLTMCFLPLLTTDVAMATAVILLAGVAVRYRATGNRTFLLIGLPASYYAINARHGNVLTTLPLILLVLVPFLRPWLARIRLHRPIWSVAGAAAVAVGMLLAQAGLNRMVRAEPNNASHHYYHYMVGTLYRADGNLGAFPDRFLKPGKTKADLLEYYLIHPGNADIFSAWGENLTRQEEPLLIDVGSAPLRDTLDIVLQHPLAFLRYRVDMARDMTRHGIVYFDYKYVMQDMGNLRDQDLTEAMKRTSAYTRDWVHHLLYAWNNVPMRVLKDIRLHLALDAVMLVFLLTRRSWGNPVMALVMTGLLQTALLFALAPGGGGWNTRYFYSVYAANGLALVLCVCALIDPALRRVLFERGDRSGQPGAAA
ncbi:MAG: hypothetical protein AB7O80_18290 [Acetobacteraceae bacterium]